MWKDMHIVNWFNIMNLSIGQTTSTCKLNLSDNIAVCPGYMKGSSRDLNGGNGSPSGMNKP